MASRIYRVNFTPHDDKSTDALEMVFEIRTASGGLGTLIADGRCTSGSATSIVVTDNYLTPGISNPRFIRTFDGAANPFDTEFAVEVPQENVPEVLEGSVIGVGFVFEWRDHRYNFLSDLTPAIETANVELINKRAIARTATFRMDPAEFPEGFDPKRDRISIRAKFLREGLVAQFPLGLFSLDVGKRRFFATGDPLILDPEEVPEPTETIAADGSDVCSHLEEERVDTAYTVDSGTNYITAVETLIESVTFTDFTGQARPMRYELPATDHVTPVDFTWPPETSVLTIINDLLAGINYFNLWADGQAVLRSRERVLPWIDATSQVYTTLAEPRMIVSPFGREELKGQYPNQILATVDDPARASLTASRVNSDPASLIGTPNAKPYLQTKQTPRIVDATVQEAFADYELAVAAGEADRGILTTAFDPRRDSREHYQLEIGGLEENTLWIVFAWSLSMQTGSLMIHDIGRADAIEIEDLTL